MSRPNWIQTFTGVAFEPMNPDPAKIVLEDIAHALSHLCRYTGHVRRFYSVAEHSVRVCRVLEARGLENVYLRAGLLHDASEAYLTDLAAPVKNHLALKGYRDAEAKLELAVWLRFRIAFNPAIAGMVRKADLELLNAERLKLLGAPPQTWGDLPDCRHVPTDGMGWEPWAAKRLFLQTAERLGIK